MLAPPDDGDGVGAGWAGGYGREDVARASDPEEYCPEADTGAPYEPVIRDQFEGATYKFLFGLGQDELGYIVPKYDFWAFGFPPGENDTVPIPPPFARLGVWTANGTA